MGPANPINAKLSRAEFPDRGLPEILHSKYKLRILWNLRQGALRFGEMRRRLPRGLTDQEWIAPRVLSRELRYLTDLGLVQRRAYDFVPPKVEYRLTVLGRTLLPIISDIVSWGAKHALGAHGEIYRLPVLRSDLRSYPEGKAS